MQRNSRKQMQEVDTDPVFRQALEWFLLVRDEKASDEDRAALETWLLADPAHGLAYARARRLWDRFDLVKPEYERLSRSGRIGRRSLLLGGLVALVGAPSLYVVTRPEFSADYSTGIAERRTFTLPDGSTAELGSYSAASLQFTEEERRLVLHRGQGFFRVAAEARRPFLVEAAAGTTRALGTQFDVKLSDAEVTVAVLEHSVAVETPTAAPVVVREGWQISYGEDGPRPPARVDATGVKAWRQDRIVFEDVPLRRVLVELQRYRHGRIMLMDNGIGATPVTAIFETAHAEKALQTIAETLPVRIVNATAYLTFVYAR
jgi:transmembrane sensor